MWVLASELPASPAHRFYARLNAILEGAKFDEYFRLLLLGYFEGLDSERGIAWRVADSLAKAGLLSGKTLSVDRTTLEANAAMRSIVRRDTEETYPEFLMRLATASGLKTPSRAALARLDRRRKKKGNNEEWKSPADPDAKITKMKDGRMDLAHKAEHAVDLKSGAVVGVTPQEAGRGDTETIEKALTEAQAHL